MESRDSEDFKNGIKFDNRIFFDHAFDHFHGRIFHRRAFPRKLRIRARAAGLLKLIFWALKIELEKF